MSQYTAAKRRITVDEICAGGFSTPLDAPTVPPFPFEFRNVEVLTLAYRSDPAAMACLLPPPLELTGDVVLIHIYKMNDTDWLGPYSEANVMFGAKFPEAGLAGAYSPYLYLSSEVGVVHGREIHGQPKKLGIPRLEARGDIWAGTLSRNGIDIVTGTLAYKQNRAALSALSAILDFSNNFNLKAIDHIDGTPAIRQLTARRLANIHVHECWQGACTVELRPNVQAPVYRLPVAEMLDGFYWRGDFTLVPGTVLHDYLKP
ncbi:acetoacetate decarboxylase [Verminephrobacter aporrectodeae subsp. tuberculatae]|uniref:acetoacetate decarboxylase n=1 Tax=Verminephrobacter aporrectodeae TaxID=1110389 RepID=UPI002244CB19|nr:acetoacetate decarboxylase [Verminephrobacter aporrectodeae]MCW8197110.1 acetoacetate decarboxylase [Verminephrobacter aporrectodeae subsp. tuberculatae]